MFKKLYKPWSLIFFLVISCILVLGFTFFTKKTEMTIYINFDSVEKITRKNIDKGINAYYRGLQIGKIFDARLTEDQKKVKLKLDIYHKNLMLPQNTRFQLRTEDIFGNRYLDIIYPEKPAKKIIKNGDSLEGYLPATLTTIEKFIEDEINSGRLNKILSNTEELTDYLILTLKENKKDFNRVIKKTISLLDIFDESLIEFKKLTSDPNIGESIKNTLQNTEKSIKIISELIDDPILKEKINKTHKKLLTTLDKMPEINNKLETTNNLLTNTNSNLCEMNNELDKIPPGTLESSGAALNKLCCIGDSACDLLSKRFLIFRMLFGKPGESFENCKKIPCK